MSIKNDCQLLIFDWGDTLMRVFPQYSGVMVKWPVVKATPGAAQGLAGLAGYIRMVVGTNAADSSALMVQQALDRVGLGKYFEAVFTTHEIEVRKPDPAFFWGIIRLLNIEKQHAAVVGDDFLEDITGARNAGLRAIWLNPQSSECPFAIPVQDADIKSLAELTELLNEAWLPTIEVCEAWLRENGAGERLLAHVRQVARCAYRMAAWLRQRGVIVNPVLAQRGGLLHDLDKISAATQYGNHGELASRLLSERGEFALAAIARRHVMHKIREYGDAPQTWEEKLVYYADKLVEGDTVVSWQVRLQALRQRYPEYIKSFELSKPHLAALEQAICQALTLTPEELVRQLQK
jgi:phosphoglycolate phosphatase-like HAD superfamily hydrolase